VKGKWAQGLRPRAFTWVIKDKIAVAERPGGYARNHRKVRRDEELIWLEQNGFTHVLSLLDSSHNLAAYEEAGIAHAHVALGRAGAEAETLPAIYELLLRWYRDPGELVLVHHEEFGDRLCGVIGGFLLAAGLLDSGPTAVAVTERLTGRQLGPEGRAIVHTTIVEGLAPRVEPEPEPAPEPPRSMAKKSAAKNSATRTRAAKKAAAKKAPAKKSATKKPATKKPAAKKAPAKKAAAKKAPAKKPVAKKPAAKKPSAKKSATKKPAAKKAPAKKPATKKPAAKKAPAKKKGR